METVFSGYKDSTDDTFDDSLFDLDIRVSSFEPSRGTPERPYTDPNKDWTCNASRCDGSCNGTCGSCNVTCYTCYDTCSCVVGC